MVSTEEFSCDINVCCRYNKVGPDHCAIAVLFERRLELFPVVAQG